MTLEVKRIEKLQSTEIKLNVKSSTYINPPINLNVLIAMNDRLSAHSMLKTPSSKYP